MKKQNMFIALFLAAVMLLLFGNVSSADPMLAPPGGPQHHDTNMAPPDLVGVGPTAPAAPPMYGGPNDHHLQAPVDMDGGHDCAGLPTPGEVAACWDAKNQHANQHHVEAADPGHHPPGMP